MFVLLIITHTWAVPIYGFSEQACKYGLAAVARRISPEKIVSVMCLPMEKHNHGETR